MIPHQSLWVFLLAVRAHLGMRQALQVMGIQFGEVYHLGAVRTSDGLFGGGQAFGFL